jgi:putative nucleotidyltransferase with HDIG domain
MPPLSTMPPANPNSGTWPAVTDPRLGAAYSRAGRSLPAAAALVAGLKPFPSAATELMTLLSNPETPMHRIRAAIERDPAFVTRLLHVANSAAYRPTRACCSIEEAVARLGSKNVFDIVVGVAALGTFNSLTKGGKRIRDHLVGVAAIARLLGVEWGGNAGAAFTCGLLHDIGKLLLMQVGEVNYDALPSAMLDRADRSHLYELPLLGYDHATLGCYVLEHWRLPDSVANVVLAHHDPEASARFAPDERHCVTLVRAADHLEYALRQHPRVNDTALAEVATEAAILRAGLGEGELRKLWPAFVSTNADLRRALGY